MFREAVSFTAAGTGFSPRLIEKDYYCTVLLKYFSPIDRLVFKGGTCLAKVLAHFYRVSCNPAKLFRREERTETFQFRVTVPL